MRIILKDPTLILVGVVGTIFSVAMIGLLLQLTSEIDTMRKSWTDMTCLELKKILVSAEYEKLSDAEAEDFDSALKLCVDT